MNEQQFRNYLETRYEKQMQWYDRKAERSHRTYLVFQWAALLLSASAPVLIVVGDGATKWLAVAVAILVAVATGALKVFKYQENWTDYRTTCEMLRKEFHFYEAGLRGYEAADDREALFVDRVEGLISREHSLWSARYQRYQSGRARGHSSRTGAETE